MALFKGGKTAKRSQVEDDEAEPTYTKGKVPSIGSAEERQAQKIRDQNLGSAANRSLKTGKIHIETLFNVFKQFQRNVGNSAYGAGDDPFLLERRVAEQRLHLKKTLDAMGFEDLIDYGFIPMPEPVKVGVKTAVDLEKNKGKGKKRAQEEEDD